MEFDEVGARMFALESTAGIYLKKSGCKVY